MDLGKFDLAALHMKLLLAKEGRREDVDKDLVKIEEADGMAKFLRPASGSPVVGLCAPSKKRSRRETWTN